MKKLILAAVIASASVAAHAEEMMLNLLCVTESDFKEHKDLGEVLNLRFMKYNGDYLRIDSSTYDKAGEEKLGLTYFKSQKSNEEVTIFTTRQAGQSLATAADSIGIRFKNLANDNKNILFSMVSVHTENNNPKVTGKYFCFPSDQVETK